MSLNENRHTGYIYCAGKCQEYIYYNSKTKHDHYIKCGNVYAHPSQITSYKPTPVSDAPERPTFRTLNEMLLDPEVAAGVAREELILDLESELASLRQDKAELLEALKQALDRMEAIEEDRYNRYSGFTPACEAAIAFARKAIANAEKRTR